MGLLGRALAAGIGAAADTGANMLMIGAKYDHEAELAQARYAAERNLEDLRNTYATTRDDAKDQRLQEREQRTADATLTDYQDQDGNPLTRGQVISATKAKQEASKIQADAQDKANTENIQEGQTDELNRLAPSAQDTFNGLIGIQKPQRSLLDDAEPSYTPEEQAKINSAEKTKVQSTKAIEAAIKRKEDAENKLEQIKLGKEESRETLTQVAKINGETRRDVAASNRAGRGEKDASLEKERQARLEDQAADKMLAVYRDPAAMPQEIRKQYNRHRNTSAKLRDEPVVEHGGLIAHYKRNNAADVFGSGETVSNPFQAAGKKTGLNLNDPKVQRAKAAGYSDDQIQAYLAGQ